MSEPKRIVIGETMEIRCELKREGQFRYTNRYFQPDGEGKLRMNNGIVLLPVLLHQVGSPPQSISFVLV